MTQPYNPTPDEKTHALGSIYYEMQQLWQSSRKPLNILRTSHAWTRNEKTRETARASRKAVMGSALVETSRVGSMTNSKSACLARYSSTAKYASGRCLTVNAFRWRARANAASV